MSPDLLRLASEIPNPLHDLGPLYYFLGITHFVCGFAQKARTWWSKRRDKKRTTETKVSQALDRCSSVQYADQPVPLHERHATHVRVSCDRCGPYQTAEVCCRRDSGSEGKKIAVEKLRKAGWHVSGLNGPRERWFCPTCAKNKHL